MGLYQVEPRCCELLLTEMPPANSSAACMTRRLFSVLRQHISTTFDFSDTSGMYDQQELLWLNSWFVFKTITGCYHGTKTWEVLSLSKEYLEQQLSNCIKGEPWFQRLGVLLQIQPASGSTANGHRYFVSFSNKHNAFVACWRYGNHREIHEGHINDYLVSVMAAPV